MTVVNKNIVNTYSNLFEGLDNMTRKKLIGHLTRSLSKLPDAKERAFYKSFGAFPNDKQVEPLLSEIKSSKAFRQTAGS